MQAGLLRPVIREVGEAGARLGTNSSTRFSSAVSKVGKVVRCICLLDHPIPDTKVTHPP